MKTKIYFKIAVIVLLLVFINSCDYLDVVPDNIATIDDAFSNRSNAEKFLATCYSYMPYFHLLQSNPGFAASDEIYLNNEILNRFKDRLEPASNISKGLQNSTDPYLNYWEGRYHGRNMFIAIRDCNIFLEEIHKVIDISDEERKEWIAEVKFLKAFFHFWLFKCYGPIPIIKENLPIYVETEDIKIYRDPVDDVIDFIVTTIDEAIPDLPMVVMSETSDMGRITRPIAMAIKAKVLVTAASPLFNGNPDFANLTDNRGTKLFNSVYDPEKWKIAAKAALDAIDTCEVANIMLYEEYDTRHSHSEAMMKILTLQSIFTSKESPEVIWASTGYRFDAGQQTIYQPHLIGSTDGAIVAKYGAATFRMAELFYSNNGVPINEDKYFDYKNRYNVRVARTEENDYVRSGEKTALLHFDREPRFYSSLAFDRGTYVLDPTYYYVQLRVGEVSSKNDPGYFTGTGYWPKKLISPRNSFSINRYLVYYSYPFPIIRLADLYLLYAEAINETKSAPDSEVYEYIDKVRKRAGLEGIVDSWSKYSDKPLRPSSKVGMREIIQTERMIELSFEGHRFWDLRRWKLAEEYLNKPYRGWSINAPGLDIYNIQTLYRPTFEFKDYFWPIREEEMLKNPNLVQNLGW